MADRGAGRPGREGGFTLIEIAIGIVILGLGLMALAQTMVTAARVERVTYERKVAITWVTSQIERIRSMGISSLAQAPPTGYLVTTSSEVGSREDTDKDGDEDRFERYYYAPGTPDYAGPPVVPLGDSALLGLQAQDGASGVIGTVTFTEPDVKQNGVGEGSGYWVTVRVKWKGTMGNSEAKVSTYVGR